MYSFSKKQKIIIGIILVIISIILINYVYSRETSTFQNDDLNTYEEKSEEETVEKTEETNKEIIVHIAGAVKTEGVVFLKEGDRINKAIEKAGGTTEEADMSQVNLAYQLEDGMKIYIPKKGENMEEESIQDDSVNSTNTEKATNNKTTKNTSKININKATQEELENLPGIGPSTALKIISYREENGKFKSIESIKDISGIGEAKYNSIKDLITV